MGVPLGLLKPNLTPREREVIRANFNETKKQLKDGVHVLTDADDEITKRTRVRTELKVEQGKGVVRPVHDGARVDTPALYGDLSVRLENPGDVYFSHSMKEGKVYSLVACEATTS